jgi:hypothetical protein
MLNRKALALAAGFVVFGNSLIAKAADPAQPSQPYTSARPTLLQGTQAPARRPLMELLDRAGVAKPLQDAGINIYGHVEAGWTWNFDDPSDNLNPFRIFDFEHNEPILDQLDFTVERAVDYRKNKFDVGFKGEIMYGADAGIIHSNGLFDWYDGIRKPENQWDLTQAYVDVVVPVGTGLRLRMGKFVNFVGYETINPTTGGIVDFYSRSLIFFNYPFTHTGIIGTYDITKEVTLTLGISRGDNQSTEDNNDAISFLGSVNWVINEQWALYVSNSTGPERTDNNSDYRTTWDGTLFFTPTKELTAAANVYYVWEAGGAADGSDAQLYALALLASYQFDPMFALKGRVEWIHDGDNYRLGPIEDIYEATLGLTIRPFPNDQWGSNVKLRPEVRWDHSPDDAFHGDNNQFTFGIDVVVTF